MEQIKGERKYGAWAGNPNGTPEDTTKCIVEVWEQGRSMFHHQCNRKRGYGKDGLYCKIHDPEYIKEKDEARNEKYNKELAMRRIQYSGHNLLQACKDALEASHNPIVEKILMDAINKAEGNS